MKQIYDMLKLENIKILAGVKDWKEAIYTAVQPLVDGGYCEARYSDEIIKNTEKLGPYYVLCENVALIHGSAEQGVIKRQIAVTLLKEPLKFKEYVLETSEFGGYNGKKLSNKNIELILLDPKQYKIRTNYNLNFFD